jgi:hypothetical protein
MSAGIALKVKAPNLDALQKKLSSKPALGTVTQGVSAQPLANFLPSRQPKPKMPLMPRRMVKP